MGELNTAEKLLVATQVVSHLQGSPCRVGHYCLRIYTARSWCTGWTGES